MGYGKLVLNGNDSDCITVNMGNPEIHISNGPQLEDFHPASNSEDLSSLSDGSCGNVPDEDIARSRMNEILDTAWDRKSQKYFDALDELSRLSHLYSDVYRDIIIERGLDGLIDVS